VFGKHQGRTSAHASLGVNARTRRVVKPLVALGIGQPRPSAKQVPLAGHIDKGPCARHGVGACASASRFSGATSSMPWSSELAAGRMWLGNEGTPCRIFLYSSCVDSASNGSLVRVRVRVLGF
jgi:hypothetical protein